MNLYEVEIRYPNHLHPQDAASYPDLDALDVESKFDAIQWRRQLTLQLQLESHDTTFRVEDHATDHVFILTLKGYASESDLRFKLESNVEVMTSHKNLFGLLTVKTKEKINFPLLSLAEARECLSQFLSQNFEPMRERYRDKDKRPAKA